MAIFVLTNAKVWLDAYDISGKLNELGLDYAAELPDSTVFSSGTTRSRTPGLKHVKATLKGFDDFADDNIDEQAHALLGVQNSVMSCSAEGGDEGETGFFFRAATGKLSRGGAIGDMFPFDAEAEGSDGMGLLRGTIMHNATRTTSASGTARQLGAVSATQKLYAALHVLSASAGDTLDVIVESDNAEGFPSTTTRITFTQVAAIGAQFATPVAGAITDDWWRIGWTVGGASISFQFVCIVAIF